MADSGIRPVMDWLRRVVTQPLDELKDRLAGVPEALRPILQGHTTAPGKP